MLSTQTQLALIGKNKNPVTVITGLRYNANILKTFNNMTFAYDPNWEYAAGNPTYPISFFYIKTMTESMNSEISSKPMLFYNSESGATDGTRAGLLNIISDNIVIKPKVYKLEILIPANATVLMNSSYNTYNITNTWSFMANKGASDSKIMSQVMQVVNVSMDIIEGLLRGLYGSALAASSVCNMLLQQQDYNKNSIDFMWRNRRIIKLKDWNGWKFKYLAIQNFECSKIGENGDFYEGTLVCQEVPILTFRDQKQTVLWAMSKISSALGKAQKVTTEVFIKGMTASIGE